VLDFNEKLRRENNFKPTIGNESLHQDIVKFATSKHLVVKSTMFPHRNIHKYTLISLDGQTHNQFDHILIVGDGIRVYSMYDLSREPPIILIIIWWFQKLEKILAIIKQAAQKFVRDKFTLRKLNELGVRRHQIKILNRLATLENLSDSEDINMAWKTLEKSKHQLKSV